MIVSASLSNIKLLCFSFWIIYLKKKNQNFCFLCPFSSISFFYCHCLPTGFWVSKWSNSLDYCLPCMLQLPKSCSFCKTNITQPGSSQLLMVVFLPKQQHSVMIRPHVQTHSLNRNYTNVSFHMCLFGEAHQIHCTYSGWRQKRISCRTSYITQLYECRTLLKPQWVNKKNKTLMTVQEQMEFSLSRQEECVQI